MMRFVFLFFLLLLTIVDASAQQVNAIKITDLEKRIQNSSDTTYIVNFWATWCVPCVKELPDFDSINNSYLDKKVKVLLVSLDFKEDTDSKLKPFIAAKKIKSEVLLLDETNANYFIPKVSNLWTGAIPATLIKNNNKKYEAFYEKRLNYLFLSTEIDKIND